MGFNSGFKGLRYVKGENVWYRIVILCTGIVRGWLVPELQIMQQLLTVFLSLSLLTYIWPSVLWNQNFIPVRCGHMILKIASDMLNLFQ